MGRRKISTTVYLEPEQLEDLKALAAVDRRPFAAVLREAVDAYLERRRAEVPPRKADPRQSFFRFKGDDGPSDADKAQGG